MSGWPHCGAVHDRARFSRGDAQELIAVDAPKPDRHDGTSRISLLLWGSGPLPQQVDWRIRANVRNSDWLCG